MRRFTIAVMLALSVGLTAVTPSWASAIQEKIDKARHTLDQLKQTIETTQKRRDQSQKKHGAVLQSIERLDRRLHKERDEATAVKRDIKRLDLTLETIRAKLPILRSQMDARKAVLATRLRRLYMEGRAGWFRPLLAADSYAQFQRRVRYLSVLVAWERRGLEAHRRDMKRIERLHAQQAKARETLLSKRGLVDKKLLEMKEVKSKKNAVLAGFAKQTQSHEERLAVLKQSENRKEVLLNELHQRGRMPDADSRSRASGSFQKGALLWPAEGRLVGTFGRQKHPTFDTYVEKKGIAIATSEGMAIRAVSDGDVVYADWLKGYGLVVILDHGANYFTFYAHASQLLVKKGEAVARGTTLGKTGSSGLTDRVVLYFELRKGTRPVNPLGWFAGK